KSRAHHLQALKILADNFRQQKRGNCRDDERDQREADRVREYSAVAAFSLRKCGKELRDARAKVDRQAENRAELDNDRIHLPIAVRQADVEQSLGNSEMGG